MGRPGFEAFARALSLRANANDSEPGAVIRRKALLDAMDRGVGATWQTPFFANLDALLSALRSVPEIIQCCFGYDPNWRMKEWFSTLTEKEKDRRCDFTGKFDPSCIAFKALALSEARHVIEHRTGFAPVEVTIIGHFGVTYVGGPAAPIKTTEIPVITDPTFPPGMAKPRRLNPTWRGFTIQGQPLFEACQQYLNEAGSLTVEGRRIAIDVHGDKLLTAPEL